MYKNCPKCGMKNDEDAPFCTNCGARFVESIAEFRTSVEVDKNNNFEQQSPNIDEKNVNFENSYNDGLKSDFQVYGEPSPHMPKKSKSTKPIIAIIAIVIVAMLVGVAFFVFFAEEKDEKDGSDLDNILNSITGKIEGGPTVSMQSLGSGSFQSTPDEGCVAKYYLYSGGEKVGEAVEANTGQTTYNGINCHKILGRSTVNLDYMNTDIAFTMDYTYYINANNNVAVYMDISYEYTKPQEATASSTISWNQNTGEIKMDLPGTAQDTDMDFPTEYWGMLSSLDALYVGYSEQIDYTMTTDGDTTPMEMSIDVKSQEDVTVPAGTFENCYRIEFSQVDSTSIYSTPTTFLKIWISEDGFAPKVVTTSLGLDLTQELEGYYTTS